MPAGQVCHGAPPAYRVRSITCVSPTSDDDRAKTLALRLRWRKIHSRQTSLKDESQAALNATRRHRPISMIPRILPNDDPGHAPQRFMHLFLIDNAETQPMAMCRLDMRNVARSYVMYHVAEYAL